MKRYISLMLACLFPALIFGQATKGYYQYPTISADKIIFSAEGDLWVVPMGGGTAERLTTHPGEESNPAFSPDGMQVAFSAQYDGPTEIYIMPTTGGLPKRLTFEGRSAITVDWNAMGVIYSTRHFATLPNTQLASINPSNGKTEIIPLSQASEGTLHDNNKTLFFTRLHFQGSWTKRYKGGTAQNIWKYDMASNNEAVPLTGDFAGTSKHPMWWNGRIYFASDRDGNMNIWSMKADGSNLLQHTKHVGWDVQSTDLSHGMITYQLGADIHLYDIAAGKDSKLDISLASDLDQRREKWIDKPMDYLTAAHISPDGSRIALTARGQVFTAPVKQGRLAEVTRREGVRYRDAKFMPDGKSLVALSDESGELEFWKLPGLGMGEPVQLTTDGKVFRYDGEPSPDGNWIVHTDKDWQIWLYNTKNKRQKLIERSEYDRFYNVSWSPDSKWMTYVSYASNAYGQIKLYNVSKGATTILTTDRVDSYRPSWSSDGKWLYFLSDRDLRSMVRSPWGARAPEPFFTEYTKIYQIALVNGLRSPFRETDELFATDTDKKDEKGKDKKVKVKIDLGGIQTRIIEVPVASGNYSGLSVNGDRIFYVSRETSFSGDRNLMALSIGNEGDEPETLVEGIRSYELSGDGKHLLIRKGSNLYVIKASASASAKLSSNKIDLDNWGFTLDPREEWRQMFTEAWRLQRDYFYDKNMHGVDWKALHDTHYPLVDRITTRQELANLMAQLAGEVSALHTFVYGGDHRSGKDDVAPGSLGAKLVRDESAGGFRIEHIYASDPDYPEDISPLARPGLNIAPGTVILKINGVSTLSVGHPNALLRNQVGQQVRLQVVNPRQKPRDIIVKPISPRQADGLRYDEWEYTRRLEVEKAGKSDIGYVHLRAMGGNDIAQWARDYYPVFNRKGLIIDVRHNRGGNIDSWILEKLMRKIWFYWGARVGAPTWNMQYAFPGHMVVLVNERTASDGEAFAEGFRQLGLGKIIGTRTWGGEIWLTSSNGLVDRGIVTSAEFGVYGPEGDWLIEGHGVDPDIIVDNLPNATFGGKDAQLEAAIKYLQEQIRLYPVEIPAIPKKPNKSANYNKQ